MSHVTHIDESCHTHERVMSHIWTSHVTRMNESCHTYEWVRSHVWMSHVTYMNDSCHTCEWVMSLQVVRTVWFDAYECEVTHLNMSCHTYEWVMSHIWMSHVTHMNESCHTHECQNQVMQQTEKIALQIITTTKISNKFSRNSYQTRFHGSPKFSYKLSRV